MSEPIPVLVKRYKCPFCSRSRSREQVTRDHIARCWLNPDNKTCKTCANFVPSGCCGAADLYGCYAPMCSTDSCDAGVELPEGPGFPVTGCPLWKSRDDEDFDSPDVPEPAVAAPRTPTARS